MSKPTQKPCHPDSSAYYLCKRAQAIKSHLDVSVQEKQPKPSRGHSSGRSPEGLVLRDEAGPAIWLPGVPQAPGPEAPRVDEAEGAGGSHG